MQHHHHNCAIEGWTDLGAQIPGPWPMALAIADLRQHVCANTLIPGQRRLAKRWGWTVAAVRALLASVHSWADPRDLEASLAADEVRRGRSTRRPAPPRSAVTLAHFPMPMNPNTNRRATATARRNLVNDEERNRLATAHTPLSNAREVRKVREALYRIWDERVCRSGLVRGDLERSGPEWDAATDRAIELHSPARLAAVLDHYVSGADSVAVGQRARGATLPQLLATLDATGRPAAVAPSTRRGPRPS